LNQTLKNISMARNIFDRAEENELRKELGTRLTFV